MKSEPADVVLEEPVTPTPPPKEPRLAAPSFSTNSGPNHHPGGGPKRRRPRIFLAGGVAVLGLAGLAYYGVSLAVHPPRVDLVTHTVRMDRLELTVVERGALESADNHDVYCRVKSGAKNSTVATTIKSVVDDGSQVTKGQVIVDLDDSGLGEQLKSQKITLDKAESDKIQAEEAYKIQIGQNESDIQSAETTLQLAKIDLQKYLEGDFPQALKDVNGRIKTAESDLEQQRDRAAWAQRMVKKGYQTVSQAQSEQSKQESLEIALAKVTEEKRVLVDPVFGLKKRTETDLANKVAVAEQALSRTKGQAVAKEIQAKTDRETKRSIYQQELTHYKEIEDEIKKCKIFAPQDGMVVYFIPEQARGGGGSQQSIVAQGEPVREGQKLMQIPDLSHMLVNTKVHEAMVSRVKKGQKATVKIDAYPDRVFPGHVESVATLSAQQDWLSADVKVYVTKVAVDEQVEGLKPGMSAEVSITVGDPLEKVLTVPVQAIVGSVEMGAKRRIFVLTPNGPEARDVVVGLSNDRKAEIRDGLKEGEQVVLNPKSLVGNALKTNQPGAALESGDSPKTDQPPAAPTGAPKEKTTGPKPAGGAPAAGIKTGAPGGRPEGGPGGDSEERKKQGQQRMERFKNASPEERKQMLEQVPEQYRERMKEQLKAQGIEIKD